jgi:hypothetical protein
MSEPTDEEFIQALEDLVQARRRLQTFAVQLPTAESSWRGRVPTLAALRAAIECTVVDRLDPALAALHAVARQRRIREALRKPRESRP